VTRVVVTHQAVPPDAPLDERDVLGAAEAVRAAIASRGWAVETLAVTLDLAAAAAQFAAEPPDLVFNLVEGLPGIPGAGSLVSAPAELFQGLGLRFTGAGPAALALTSNKPAMRRVLQACGIAIAPGPEHGAPGPYIIKHAFEHASFGLGAHSVVAELPDALAQDCFAEAFVDGREFNVAAIERDGVPMVLPIAELVFAPDWPPEMPRILDYDGKWRADHPLYARSTRRFAGPGAELDAELAARLRAAVEACWRLLGLAGYARVDVRVGADGVPRVIDVNANPALAPDAGLAAAAAAAGIDFPTLVGGIADAALRPRQPSANAVCHRPGARRTADLREDLTASDVAAIAALCRDSGFFAAAEVAIARELADDRLKRGADSDYRFLLAEDADGRLLGYACFGPTPCASGAWDLYWIVVGPVAQRSGVGRQLVEAVIAVVGRAGGRRLFAETSGRPLYAPTRAFYAGTGFRLQASVADFYADGDAKQIWMRLVTARHDAGPDTRALNSAA